MPQLTLYRGKSSCALAPRALLFHLGIPFTPIDMLWTPDGYKAADGSLSQEEYRQTVHHAGYVPALVIVDDTTNTTTTTTTTTNNNNNNKTIITENPAVISYIASLAPARQLLGRDPLERAQVQEWMAWLSGTLHGYGWAMLKAPKRFTADPEAYEGIRKRGHEVMVNGFGRVEERLKGKRHAVGERVTVVDFNLYVFWFWGKEMGLEMGQRFPAYGEVIRELEKLEGVKEAARLDGWDV